MGLKVITDGKPVTVYVKDKQTQNGGTFKSYSVAIASKDRDGNWVNGYLDCQFKKGVEIFNKAKINITNSFYTVSEYQGKKYLKLFVLEFDVVEEGEKPQTVSGGEEWMNVPDLADEDFPFN